jgi:hypothetical protein
VSVKKIKSEEDAWEFVEKIINRQPVDFSDDFRIEYDSWPIFRIYISKPKLDSSISPSMMEVFSDLQKNIYQTVALLKYSSADIRHLTNEDRREYEISVVVKGGSSDQSAELANTLNSLGLEAIRHMTPEQVTISILGLGLLVAGFLSFKSYLENRKDERIAEINKDERRAYLETMQFSEKSETERVKMLTDALKESAIGNRIIISAENVHSAILKAASNNDSAEYLSQNLTAKQAQELRSNQRRRAVERTIEQEMRVIDVNTQNPRLIRARFFDPKSGEELDLEFGDTILSETGHKALFIALESRVNVLVKMKIKDLEGEISPIEIIAISSTK